MTLPEYLKTIRAQLEKPDGVDFERLDDDLTTLIQLVERMSAAIEYNKGAWERRMPDTYRTSSAWRSCEEALSDCERIVSQGESK